MLPFLYGYYLVNMVNIFFFVTMLPLFTFPALMKKVNIMTDNKSGRQSGAPTEMRFQSPPSPAATAPGSLCGEKNASSGDVGGARNTQLPYVLLTARRGRRALQVDPFYTFRMSGLTLYSRIMSYANIPNAVNVNPIIKLMMPLPPSVARRCY